MTLEEIVKLVKTKYYNFGLKDKNIEKLANVVKTNMEAMGAIEDEQAVLNQQISALEPFLAVFQSELDSRRQPQPQPQTQPQPDPTPAPQPAPQPQMPEGWEDIVNFVEAQKKKEQQQAQFQTRAQLMDTVKSKISPNGVLDETTLYKLFSLHSDRFTGDADVEDLAKTFQEEYNKEAINIIPNNPFVPPVSVPGVPVADTDKKSATLAKVKNFVTNRRIS